MATNSALPSTAHLRSILLPAIGVSIPLLISNLTTLTIILAAAEAFALSNRQTTTLIVALLAIPAILRLILSLVYRQPIFVIWSSASLIFIASLANQYTYSEAVGATTVAGLLVMAIGGLGLSTRLAQLIPPPLVYGVLAGLLLSFVVRIFDGLDATPLLVGATLAAFLLARRHLTASVPPILVALVVGIVVAGLLGDVHRAPHGWSMPSLTMTAPTFSWQAILTIAPMVAIFITVQSNVPSIVYLRSQHYEPPKRVIDLTTGGSTAVGSLFGVVPVTMGSFVMPLVAGPEAGPHTTRYWSVVATVIGSFLIALVAAMAADIPSMIPLSLLMALAGLAFLSVFGQALTEVTKGPLKLGPLFAFVVATSNMSLLGFGPPFWALVIGMAVTLLLEQAELQALRATT